MLETEGKIGKVRLIEPEESRVWIDFQDGKSVGVALQQWHEFAVGDVIFCRDYEEPERVADELWGQSTQVGTVRYVSNDRVVIEVDGSLRAHPQRASSPFKVGHTVEIESTGRPGRLLSPDPIDRLGLADREAFDIDDLVFEPSDDITLQDFGGSSHIVSRAVDLVTVALDPENRIKAIGANPIKGMLFTGPPGTGKTHLARVLAAGSSAKFYNIGGPAIIDQFVGQSERTLRSIFEHARRNAPAVLFFDEIDSLFTQRGASTHEHTNRLVGQFLSLLDGFSAFDRVLIIATTNLHESLDNALLRPGRLSHKIEFGMPDALNRIAVLKASSRRIKFSSPVDMQTLAGMTEGWTSADLAAIWTEAAILAALDRRVKLCSEDVLEAVNRVQRIHAHTEKSTPE
ncbi:26S protease regulatory subunit [Actinoplanes sp. LDG1-06]|uniref:26S protease regulatory subunit n=1 Tax=Paractinoplanes ovalisporus TaxID=2810368 RepID=A0ABS2A3B2_9ACTN|nr:AAA family ATPase [Actinoplanes ovalisporus]MBM2614337.1 26S protease regulatory subunit [Actinoplanes ovalisporus]